MSTSSRIVSNSRKPSGSEPYVVGIGASAGGLSALKTLLDGFPPEPGFACVIVIHLSPEHESHLAEILQKHTTMPVRQVTSTTLLEANHVYVIPPNANLDAIDSHLRIAKLEDRRSERAPIDHFLRTLGTTHHGAAIAVILTGAGSDGSLGVRHIKERGGLTIAQDPAEAEVDGMPRNAVATGMVDLVLPLRRIADEILRFCAMVPEVPVPNEDDEVRHSTDRQLDRILNELRAITHQDFSVYRKAVLLKRLRRRMRLLHITTLDEYIELLEQQASEAEALANDLQFQPTEFFRDAEIYAELEQRIIPQIFKRKTAARSRVRAWSIGCTTGEEAYSMGMLLIEADQRNTVESRQLQIFASDSSEKITTYARAAIYPREIAASVSPARLARFFVSETGFLRVKRELHEVVVFAQHDILSDPPFAHLDLIVCQTLLSELQSDVREDVLRIFHYALEPGGVLVVGRNDTVDLPELFEALDGSQRVLCRLPGPAHIEELPSLMRRFGKDPRRLEEFGAREDAERPLDTASLHYAALERYAPASVLVDFNNTVVHFSSNAAEYLKIAGGQLSHDITQLVTEPLQDVIKHGLQFARKERASWTSEPCVVPTYHGIRRVILRVEPVSMQFVMVVFDDLRADALPAAVKAGETIDRRVLEAHRVGERLIPADFAAWRQADDNPEKQRLRDLSEQLSSAKEELRAVQSELDALEHESRRRIQEIAQISTDLQHLLASTGIATLFLDRNLKVVRFTPLIGELFGMRLTDMGRPLTDLRKAKGSGPIEEDARRVLDTLATIEREIPIGRNWYLSRMLPYLSERGVVEGVVLTLIDITERKFAEEALRDASRQKDEFLAVLAHELRNPLAPISSGIEILRKASADPRMVERIADTMGRQTKQLIRLVDDLLEVSRISGGKLQLRTNLIDLRDIVRDAVANSGPSVEKTGHELRVNVPDEPLAVNGDTARLTQVISNLLSNAVRYTPREGIITVTASAQGEEAEVVVKDNGIGIPRESLEHIFDMFYQGGNAARRPNAGLGIGLTLVKTLIELHGGTIEVYSAGPDTGSEFTIRLPLAHVLASQLQREERAHDLPGQHRILIVDDNVDAAETLSTLVRSLGEHEVRTANGGTEALERGEAFLPDVVLLDLMMPGMDGYEVARRMRDEPWGKDMLIVALSGWGQEEHRRRTREAGFDRHVTKPADLEVLRTVLEAHHPHT